MKVVYLYTTFACFEPIYRGTFFSSSLLVNFNIRKECLMYGKQVTQNENARRVRRYAPRAWSRCGSPVETSAQPKHRPMRQRRPTARRTNQARKAALQSRFLNTYRQNGANSFKEGRSNGRSKRRSNQSRQTAVWSHKLNTYTENGAVNTAVTAAP